MPIGRAREKFMNFERLLSSRSFTLRSLSEAASPEVARLVQQHQNEHFVRTYLIDKPKGRHDELSNRRIRQLRNDTSSTGKCLERGRYRNDSFYEFRCSSRRVRRDVLGGVLKRRPGRIRPTYPTAPTDHLRRSSRITSS